MQIKWFGHSSFLITTFSGKKIITDPYEPRSHKGLFFEYINCEADYITVSHSHWDHSATGQVSGSPVIYNTPGQYFPEDGIEISGIRVFHDEKLGSIRGDNIVFKISADGATVVHLGDIGHIPGNDVFEFIKSADVIMIPIGGIFTIGIENAKFIIESAMPRYVIPMHYSSEKCNFLKYSLNDFLSRFENEKIILARNKYETFVLYNKEYIENNSSEIISLESIR